LVPASHYFEWETVTDSETVQISLFGFEEKPSSGKQRKEKRAIRIAGKQSFYMAGLLRYEAGSPVFTILTRPVAPELAHIHDRMPTILSDEDAAGWLDGCKLPGTEGRVDMRYEYKVADKDLSI
jgi:putative SOS response-associated peptidase YedK